MKKTRGKFNLESDLGRPVVGWLQDLGWDVYQEVQMHAYGRRCDIVAKMGPVLWAIETKLTFGFSVLDQAYWWTNKAHRVSVAVPRFPRSPVVVRLLNMLGVGCISVSSDGCIDGTKRFNVVEDVAAPLRRKVSKGLRLSLRDEQKTFGDAGNCLGRYYTPYQATCRAVLDVVKQTPGIKLNDMIDRVHHHYMSDQSARQSIAKWANLGKIQGVRVEHDGKFLRFYPVQG